MLTDALRFLLNVVFGLFVYTALLRFIMQWMRAPFRNPVGQAVTALTDWAVKPMRKALPGFGGYDWASLVVAWLLQVLWLVALTALGAGATALLTGATAGLIACVAVIELVKAALWIVIVAVFIQALLSWVAPDGPLAGVLNALTFPLLAPVRRVVPPIGGALDLSPLIVIVLAQLVLMLPVAWLEQTVAALFR
ncbi:MAG TPA: YggT family protein [Casimicrobiaceae bacterium]|nr:YggT family protein [Casimicrobiaceae bacterium]